MSYDKGFSSIASGQNIALDTVIFIYFLEKNPQFYQLVKKIFYRIEQGDIRAGMSSLVFAELLVPAYRSNYNSGAEKIIRLLRDFPNLKIIPVTTEISKESAKLRADFNLRTPDAIHAATALHNKSDFLITNDKDLQKIDRRIKVLTCE